MSTCNYAIKESVIPSVQKHSVLLWTHSVSIYAALGLKYMHSCINHMQSFNYTRNTVSLSANIFMQWVVAQMIQWEFVLGE